MSKIVCGFWCAWTSISFGCTHWSELLDRVVCACSAFHDRTKPPSKVDVRVYIVHSPWQIVWILVLQTNKRDGCKMKFTVVLIVLFMIFTEFEPLFIYLEASFFSTLYVVICLISSVFFLMYIRCRASVNDTYWEHFFLSVFLNFHSL